MSCRSRRPGSAHRCASTVCTSSLHLLISFCFPLHPAVLLFPSRKRSSPFRSRPDDALTPAVCLTSQSPCHSGRWNFLWTCAAPAESQPALKVHSPYDLPHHFLVKCASPIACVTPLQLLQRPAHAALRLCDSSGNDDKMNNSFLRRRVRRRDPA